MSQSLTLANFLLEVGELAYGSSYKVDATKYTIGSIHLIFRELINDYRRAWLLL